MKNEKCFENEKLKDGFHMYFVSNNQIFDYWLSLAGTRNRFVNYTHYELKQVVGPTSSKHCYVANGPTYSKWSEDVNWSHNVIGRNDLDVYENSIAKRLLLCRVKCFSSVEQDRSCKMSISSNVTVAHRCVKPKKVALIQFQQVNELLLSIKMPRDGFHLELVWRIRGKPASR